MQGELDGDKGYNSNYIVNLQNNSELLKPFLG